MDRAENTPAFRCSPRTLVRLPRRGPCGDDESLAAVSRTLGKAHGESRLNLLKVIAIRETPWVTQRVDVP